MPINKTTEIVDTLVKPLYDQLDELVVDRIAVSLAALLRTATEAAHAIREATTVLSPAIRATDKLSLFDKLTGLDQQASRLELAVQTAQNYAREARDT